MLSFKSFIDSGEPLLLQYFSKYHQFCDNLLFHYLDFYHFKDILNALSSFYRNKNVCYEPCKTSMIELLSQEK